jgi:ABC-type multidrug transport system fused ATPase/permease subunit
MTVLYELTIFLAIALIAAVITIFVIAASLLGRAIEESSREQEELARKESSEFGDTIAGLQKQLKGAKKANVIDDLKKQISEYEERKKEAEKDLKRITYKYSLLTVRGTVLYPSMFFLISIVLAGIARYIVTVPLTLVSYILWGLSLAAIIWGSYRICKCLKVIEGVAITTEEAQFKRMTQALATALERHEAKKRPKIELQFKKEKPPFSFKPGAEETIEFGIIFKRGDIAKGTEAWFFAPEGFLFPRDKTWRQSDDYSIPNALTMKVILGDIRSWFKNTGKLTIKTPTESGEYHLGYRLFCEDSTGDFTKFKVKVE